MQTETYDLLAMLLAYPDDGTKSALDRCRMLLPADLRDAGVSLDRFVDATASMTTEELQELYTRTFDLNPTCSLEIGWQLFGENYARGEFLVVMRQTLRRLGVDESTELPDHLTHILAALGRMEAAEAGRFSSEFLVPVLEKMLQALTGKDVAYAAVLEAVLAIVRSQLPVAGCNLAVSGQRTPLPTIDCQLPTANWQLPMEEEVGHG